MFALWLSRAVLSSTVLLGATAQSVYDQMVLDGLDHNGDSTLTLTAASPLMHFQPSWSGNATGQWNASYTRTRPEDAKVGAIGEGLAYYYTIVDNKTASDNATEVSVSFTFRGNYASFYGFWGHSESPGPAVATIEVYDSQGYSLKKAEVSGEYNGTEFNYLSQPVLLGNITMDGGMEYKAVLRPTQGAVGVTHASYKMYTPNIVTQADLRNTSPEDIWAVKEGTNDNLTVNPTAPMRYEGEWESTKLSGNDSSVQLMATKDPNGTMTMSTGRECYFFGLWGSTGPNTSNYSVLVLPDDGESSVTPPPFQTNISTYSPWVSQSVLLYGTMLDPRNGWKVRFQPLPITDPEVKEARLYLHYAELRKTDEQLKKMDEKNLSPGAIAGAVVGGVLGALLLGALVWYLCRRKRAKGRSTPGKKRSFGFSKAPQRDKSPSLQDDKFNVDESDCLATPFVSDATYDRPNSTPGANEGYPDSYFASQPGSSEPSRSGSNPLVKVGPGRYEAQRQQRVIVTTERDAGAFQEPEVIHETLPPTYDPNWEGTSGAVGSASGGDQSMHSAGARTNSLMSELKRPVPQQTIQ